MRIAGKPTDAVSATAVTGKFKVSATLTVDGGMTLFIDGQSVASSTAPGLIPVQPQDPLTIASDDKTAVGGYTHPRPLTGSVTSLKISTE